MSKAKKTLMIITVLMFFVSMVGMASAEEVISGVVIVDDVNVRQEAKLDSSVITKFNMGERVRIVENYDKWYKIQCSNNQLGWIYSDFVVVQNKEQELIKKGIVKVDNLNLRDKPNTNSKIIKKLNKGSELIVVGQEENWYNIETDMEDRGWVSSEFIIIKPKYGNGYIVADNVNLRSDFNLESNVITKLKGYSTVYVKDYKDDWYNIITKDNQQGWIHKDYVKIGQQQKVVSRSNGSSPMAMKLLTVAKQQLGKRYVWGSIGPNTFDCSGFTYYVYQKVGIKLPRVSRNQAKFGQRTSKQNLKVGDLVFFDTTGRKDNVITHVGIYIGNGNFIHASSGRKAKKVVISTLTSGFYKEKYVTARKVF